MSKPNYYKKEGSIKDSYENYKTRMAVIGYRYYNNYEHIKKELDDFVEKSGKPIDLIVSGGCVGVDLLAERYAKENNIPVLIFLPNLSFGKRGYAIRDQEIVNHSTHMIAFPSKQGKGTQITIQMAQKKEGYKSRVIYID